MSDCTPLSAVSRRAVLGGALAGLGGLALPGFAAAAPDGVELVDSDIMWSWVHRMTAGGPRFTGSDAHRRWIDYLAGELETFGLPVRRYPTTLKYWNAGSWALTVTDAQGAVHDIPVAYYWPYSGTTPPQGITGELTEATGADPTGKIVLADRPITPLVAGAFAAVAIDAQPRSLLLDAALEDSSRLWLGAQGPKLRDLRDRGAIGAVGILPFDPADAAGQFTPHQQPHDGLPALLLDQLQGNRLRESMRHGPVTATLTLTAETNDEATIDYLAAELPGNGSRAGAILVMTHTDGQNAIEENGAAALLAMADYFTRLPVAQRDRDLLFVLSPAHMTAPSSAVHPEAWLDHHPEIADRLVAAVVPEHLGATQWDAGGTGRAWHATGKQEILVLGVGNSAELAQAVAAELTGSDLDRTLVARPYTDNLYGEATGPYRRGIPTVTAIAGPNYLVRVSENGDLDKLDPALAHRQTRYLTRLTTRLLSAPWLPAPR
ncbi:hypothetical protein O3I_036680 [Nocardia brasiliensis ATCC 700358]|uniref:Peptidase M28 domain-containing protein n=1 Tax=Nocardia brasiliensis (strain ATCC 700358 / HUJEG-1) TaxID=1133849 RepID=K0EZC0_NOCB7|nr:hypothetical protein O3I_036680 [Nocardia brasiliensis ATCC 700358]